MITSLRGKIIEKDFAYIVLDVQGVGYHVYITLDAYLKLSGNDTEVIIYIYHHIWQDGQDLFGFITKTEREVFKKLISVSGIGAKLAIRILQNVEYKNFIRMVSAEDLIGLTGISGLGKKTAEKLIFELRDKLSLLSFASDIEINDNSDKNGIAVRALVSLGYKEKDATNVVQLVLKENVSTPVEELIKNALLKMAEK